MASILSLRHWPPPANRILIMAGGQKMISFKQGVQLAVALGVVWPMAGCASIMSGRHADVSFYSNVPGAHVVIRDKYGKQVATAEMPATVALKRKRRFFLPAKYYATMEAPGFDSKQVTIDSTVNPWIIGNAAFYYGGIVGLAIDNATGAAWTPSEETFYAELSPTYYSQQTEPSAVAAAPPVALPPAEAFPAAYPVTQVAQQPEGPALAPASGTY
jgi:hypothetical protein